MFRGLLTFSLTGPFSLNRKSGVGKKCPYHFNHRNGGNTAYGESGTEEGRYQEVKFNGGIGGFINFFPIKSIAISYAPFLYRPWWDDEVRDYEVSFRFPCIISQYFGASILIAKHVQVSAGTTLYLSTAVKGSYWFFDSGVGFIF